MPKIRPVFGGIVRLSTLAHIYGALMLVFCTCFGEVAQGVLLMDFFTNEDHEKRLCHTFLVEGRPLH